MKTKQIEWKENGNKTIGFVNGVMVFDYKFYGKNPDRGYYLEFKLTPRLPFPAKTYPNRVSCETAAKEMLEKTLAIIYES